MRHGKETSEKPRVLYEIGQQQQATTTTSNSSSGGGGSGKKQEHIKRPLNAFMIWSKEQRRTMMTDYPKMHNAEISRLLGSRWKLLSEDEKHKYRIEASALKDQHREAYPDYKFRPQKRNRKRRQSNTSSTTTTSSSATATTNNNNNNGPTATKHKRKNNSSSNNEFTHRVEVISSEAEQRVVGPREHIYVIHNTTTAAAAAPHLTIPSPPAANGETTAKQFYLVPIRPKQQQQAKTVVITTTPAHHHKHVLTSPTPPPDCDDDAYDDVMDDEVDGDEDDEEVMPGGVTPPSSPMTDQEDEGCGGEDETTLIELPRDELLHHQLQHQLQSLPVMKQLEPPLMVAVVKEEPAEVSVEPSHQPPATTNLFTEEFLPLDCLFPELTPNDDDDVIRSESKKKMSAEWMYINLEAFVDESCSLLRYFENPNQPIVRKKKMKENEDLNLSTDSGLE